MTLLPAHIAAGVADGLRRAATSLGTPVYVLDRATLTATANDLVDAFADPWLLHYRLAANPSPSIVRLLADRGFGASVGSAAEWQVARRAGPGNDRLVLTGRGKGEADLELAVTAAADGAPLRWVVVESAAEAAALEAIAARRLSRSSIAAGGSRAVDAILRLRSPGGDDPSEGILAAANRSGTVRWRGFALPNGSPIQTIDAWRDAARRSLALLALLAGTMETLDTLDVGGDFPVSTDEAPAPSPARFAAELEPLLDALPDDRRPRRLAAELDSVVVARAGWLVTRVLHVEDRLLAPVGPEPSPARAAASLAASASSGSPGRRRRARLRVVGSDERTAAARVERRVGVDAGLPELPLASVSGERHPVAALTSLGRPIEGSGRFDGLERSPATIVGWTGIGADSFGEHLLPPLHRGDLLAVGLAGAYASAMWSPLAGRQRPAEVLLDPDGQITVERGRGRRASVR